MSGKAFLSHTKLDSKFCDRFDNVCASVGLARFRSDFADIAKPSWSTIKYELEHSSVLFLLVGKELVTQQSTPSPDWKYTQNWISYEVGLAHGRDIDVWVVCDSVKINFPIPYFNNYAPLGLEPGPAMKYMEQVFTTYHEGGSYPLQNPFFTSCMPCGIQFNLHARLEPNQPIVCPQCLEKIQWEKGFNWSKST